MQRHTRDIYRKNFYLPFNAFINIKIGQENAQENAPSHRSNLVQDFLQETLHSRFIKTHEWPPSSPDSNPLDYYFWNKMKEKLRKQT